MKKILTICVAVGLAVMASANVLLDNAGPGGAPGAPGLETGAVAQVVGGGNAGNGSVTSNGPASQVVTVTFPDISETNLAANGVLTNYSMVTFIRTNGLPDTLAKHGDRNAPFANPTNAWSTAVPGEAFDYGPGEVFNMGDGSVPILWTNQLTHLGNGAQLVWALNTNTAGQSYYLITSAGSNILFNLTLGKVGATNVQQTIVFPIKVGLDDKWYNVTINGESDIAQFPVASAGASNEWIGGGWYSLWDGPLHGNGYVKMDGLRGICRPSGLMSNWTAIGGITRGVVMGSGTLEIRNTTIDVANGGTQTIGVEHNSSGRLTIDGAKITASTSTNGTGWTNGVTTFALHFPAFNQNATTVVSRTTFTSTGPSTNIDINVGRQTGGGKTNLLILEQCSYSSSKTNGNGVIQFRDSDAIVASINVATNLINATQVAGVATNHSPDLDLMNVTNSPAATPSVLVSTDGGTNHYSQPIATLTPSQTLGQIGRYASIFTNVVALTESTAITAFTNVSTFSMTATTSNLTQTISYVLPWKAAGVAGDAQLEAAIFIDGALGEPQSFIGFSNSGAFEKTSGQLTTTITTNLAPGSHTFILEFRQSGGIWQFNGTNNLVGNANLDIAMTNKTLGTILDF